MINLQRAGLLSVLVLLGACGGGGQSTEVGEFANDLTGNEIKVVLLKDPDVAGVSCYLASFDRGLWDRLGKGNWFENPSNSSISCVQTGPIPVADLAEIKQSADIFSQRQSLVFKHLAVRRTVDAANGVLTYIAYSRKPVDGSAKLSLSVVAADRDAITSPSPLPSAAVQSATP
jgi:CreA protein